MRGGRVPQEHQTEPVANRSGGEHLWPPTPRPRRARGPRLWPLRARGGGGKFSAGRRVSVPGPPRRGGRRHPSRSWWPRTGAGVCGWGRRRGCGWGQKSGWGGGEGVRAGGVAPCSRQPTLSRCRQGRCNNRVRQRAPRGAERGATPRRRGSRPRRVDHCPSSTDGAGAAVAETAGPPPCPRDPDVAADGGGGRSTAPTERTKDPPTERGSGERGRGERPPSRGRGPASRRGGSPPLGGGENRDRKGSWALDGET